MAHREFLDAEGMKWDVWEVNPSVVEHELEQVRLAQSVVPDTVDHARRHGALVASALSSGWLCFESGEVKRRLAPVPPGWSTFNDHELALLCERATAARSRRGASTADDRAGERVAPPPA